MTPERRRRIAERIVRETTAAQGVPEHLEDPATIEKLAVLLDAPHRRSS